MLWNSSGTIRCPWFKSTKNHGEAQLNDLSSYIADALPLCPGNAVAAIIFLEDGNYLLQLRDNKQGIFYPGHWGLFGGGVELEEEPVDAIRREIKEELGIEIDEVVVVSRFDFDLTPMNLGKFYRIFFMVKIPSIIIKQLKLSEGKDFGFFSRKEILSMSSAIAPYDSFALWLHINQDRLICNG